MKPIERVLQALEQAGCRPRRTGDGWSALCPVHERDGRRHNPSLSVGEGHEARGLLHCHRGCDHDAVCRALGLDPRDLFVEAPEEADRPREVATYRYVDEHDALLYESVRFFPKKFLQRRPDGNGGHVWKLGGVRRVPYRLPRLLEAVRDGSTIYVVEGEKDVHALERLGLVATCNSGGAGKFLPEFAGYFAGAEEVVVIPDNDDPGREHAGHVASILEPVAKQVRILELPGLPRSGDASDWIANGGTVGELARLLEAPPLIEVEATPTGRPRVVDGASFILDTPGEIAAVWGEGENVLSAAGEACLIVGPSGVGKTTLAGQLALARCGLIDCVLGLRVNPSARRVLYLAGDRPSQVARSFRRMVDEEHRGILAERLVVWRGPLERDLAKHPDHLTEFAQEHDADTVVIDSLKDCVRELNKDEGGAGYNRARQVALAAGVELIELHHQRKEQRGTGKPTKVDDVYGSVWITAGAGSVLLLWGEPGDPIVEFSHLKQPAETVGPWKLLHDQVNGRTTVQDAVDVLEVLRQSRGLTAEALAVLLYAEPGRNETEKARRRLETLVRKGLATKSEGARGGGSDCSQSTYYAVERRLEDVR